MGPGSRAGQGFFPDKDAVLFQNTGASNASLTALSIGAFNLFLDDNGVPNPVVLLPGQNYIFEGVDGSDSLSGLTVVTFTLNGQNYQFTDGGALNGGPSTSNESIPWTQGIVISDTTTVPEPATIIVWSLLGALGIGMAFWRKRAR